MDEQEKIEALIDLKTAGKIIQVIIAWAVFLWGIRKRRQKKQEISDNSAADGIEMMNVIDQQVIKDLKDSGKKPFKPYFTASDEYGGRKYLFELPEDFVQCSSRTEFDPSFCYEPKENYGLSKLTNALPVIAIGSHNAVYDAVREFMENGCVSHRKIKKFKGENFLFSASFSNGKIIHYAYAFSDEPSRVNEALFLQYPAAIKGTALEKKLKAALDHAAETYTETYTELRL